tara:strand:- start:184 stop:534 length:351 start_codon:yes stop_codon:yes gene_type:complete
MVAKKIVILKLSTPHMVTCFKYIKQMSILFRKKIEFDIYDWQLNRDYRKYMLDSIVKKKLLEGLNKTEVKNLLGDEYNNAHSSLWTYYIGKKYYVCYVYVYLYFNKEGKVYKIRKY